MPAHGPPAEAQLRNPRRQPESTEYGLHAAAPSVNPAVLHLEHTSITTRRRPNSWKPGIPDVRKSERPATGISNSPNVRQPDHPNTPQSGSFNAPTQTPKLGTRKPAARRTAPAVFQDRPTPPEVRKSRRRAIWPPQRPRSRPRPWQRLRGCPSRLGSPADGEPPAPLGTPSRHNTGGVPRPQTPETPLGLVS